MGKIFGVTYDLPFTAYIEADDEAAAIEQADIRFADFWTLLYDTIGAVKEREFDVGERYDDDPVVEEVED